MWGVWDAHGQDKNLSSFISSVHKENIMNAKTAKPLIWFLTIGLILLVACSLGSPEATESPAETEPLEPQTTEEVEPPPDVSEDEEPTTGAITSLDEAKNAVVQIVSEGTFVNPDFSVSYNYPGTGSGFIIDPSGLALTNNHVVTGAALLKVWIGGDRENTYNAKVIAVSECSDLALIDIEGEDFPYLEWHEGPINVGLEVYAAGYPLGEPQFTLTRGIVSKEEADGETNWASIDYVIEHDATINPGNSGGPLIDEEGKVVGINYTGSKEKDQYFAIGRDQAVNILEDLEQGQDIEAIGINGEAFTTDEFSGIWVSSVESGSPADETGVEGGDIITMLEDLILASDGTMSDYCDVLRSHDMDDTLDIEVLRYATGEVLTGQLNGRELETAVTFIDSIEDDYNEIVEDTGTYSGYSTVMDDYGAIQMSIPVEWTDIDGDYWYDGDDLIGSQISAAADLDSYWNTWIESGAFFGASDDLAKLGGYVNLLDILRDTFSEECKYEGRYDYEDAVYRGKYDLFENCGDSGNVFIVLTAVPIDDPQAFLVLVETQITKDVDFDALDQILATFEVVGSLP
jgi:serine protease Do